MIERALFDQHIHSTEAPLHINLFGSPQMRWHGQSLSLARRQARALLYRLAATTAPVPRDHLCFLFWPDAPESTARRNLTVLINLLRRALPQPDLIHTINDALLLDRSGVWSDAMALDEVHAVALRDGQIDHLADVVHVYRGPFLHGFALPTSPDFAEWIDGERQSWERRYLQALSMLVDGYTQRHDLSRAISMAQRYLATDELAEDMHGRLIALYAAAGDRATALRQYERCAALLERELGIEPLPATRAIAYAVRDGHQPLAAAHAAQIDQRVIGAGRAPTRHVVERGLNHRRAPALPQRADVQVAMLWGVGGGGKTRFAAQRTQSHHLC